MTYTKPEINLVGDAARVIQFVTQKIGSELDPSNQPATPAYDLDE